MLKLIRNCSHENEVATYYSEKDQEKAIIKASSTKAGIDEIKKEVKGWVWYQSRRAPNATRNFCDIVENRENYIRIKIQYIEGCKEKYSKGIQRNSELVNNIIQHYCNIWQGDKEGGFPLHGDLCVDNVISNKDGIHIIDWEHFSPDAAPFGFDAYNLLFEQLWFSMKGRERPRKGEIEVLLDNIRLIRSSSTEVSSFYDKPLFSLHKFIRTNCRFWRNQIHRLPVFLFSEEQVMAIDKIISSHI